MDLYNLISRIKAAETDADSVAILEEELDNYYVRKTDFYRETRIMGKSVEEICLILRALDTERVADIKITMSNLDILYRKLIDEMMKNQLLHIDKIINFKELNKL